MRETKKKERESRSKESEKKDIGFEEAKGETSFVLT
jgi:hypothetical protein